MKLGDGIEDAGYVEKERELQSRRRGYIKCMHLLLRNEKRRQSLRIEASKKMMMQASFAPLRKAKKHDYHCYHETLSPTMEPVVV